MQHQINARRAIRRIRLLVVVLIVTGVGWPAQAQAVGGGPATTAVAGSGRSGPAVAASEAAALDVAWLVLLGVTLLAAGLVLLVQPALNGDRAVRRFRAQLRRPDAMGLVLTLQAQEAVRAQTRRHHPGPRRLGLRPWWS